MIISVKTTYNRHRIKPHFIGSVIIPSAARSII